MTSGALVPYRPSSSPATALTSRSSSLGLTRVFTVQTGTAIATELLYRILWDILQHLLTSLQGFAGRRLDAFSAYMEKRSQERETQRLGKVEEELAKKKEGLGIVEAVEKMEETKRWGHWRAGGGMAMANEAPGACLMIGHPGPPPGPPAWIMKAASGWDEAEWRVQVLAD